MSTGSLRDRVTVRLVEDLVGPLEPDEVLTDRPSQRYSTGILYPRGSRIRPEENEDGGQAVNVNEDAPSAPDNGGVSLHAALKPSVAGLSFAVKPAEQGSPPSMVAEVSCAVYKRVALNDAGVEVEGDPPDRAHERWRRVPLNAHLAVELAPGESRTDLGPYGVQGAELYVLVTPHAGVVTVTAALSNQRNRGESSAYDEEQHIFQVELRIAGVSQGLFAPRPSRRAQTDDDSRTAALIYRDVQEFVVGHTSSARAMVNDGLVTALATDWVPMVRVPSVSDVGDGVFDQVRDRDDERPLEAEWLAEASSEALCRGLHDLVGAYREWIAREEGRVVHIPAELQPQARLHIGRCRQGADRMEEGIDAIRSDDDVRLAFQVSQRAMLLQFGWLRDGARLVWRPFQLAFQLLVLASLAKRSHSDRETMDLLWFPTGGGKTEAYLALTAFIVVLRRLRADTTDDGAGVAVLMRYTLRLLTIQQFQRAAAMTLACELLRRRGAAGINGIPNLGDAPIGIGLWVGAAATPLTLRDALNRASGDPSTPEQLTTCPCCGSKLNWKLTPKKSTVECTTEPSGCALAATGAALPVWTIDEEVYQHTPSLLIGTVDKFAQIVRKPATAALFGRGTSHAPPDLIIQDELHLISGPLGSVAGLYEVAIDELCRRDELRPKIVGSTATIRRAEDQILALFDRSTYQFPSPGLDASNSGFAVTDTERPGRTYVGLTTAGRSATYMLQALTASLLQAATEPGVPEVERDYHWTLVAYFNSLRELGRALVLMQDDVPVSISQFASRRGEPQRRIEAPAELTSRVRSYEIRDMLERLNRPVSDPEAVDLLVASNMISVGMDIPRLGLMVVNAQPKTLSEYIQATSRVGRGKVPGLVVTMYNSMRARDRSHYETFETWHRSLYRDVEATSVTPFASRAQDKALHAVLVALVRHTVPGMIQSPVLSDIQRPAAEQVASLIESRVARVDSPERAVVAQKLKLLIDEWCSRPDLQTYWDDYNRRTSLLMSAEQFAAQSGGDADLDSEGARRALWPTPNSMREVEPGAPFVLRHVLKTEAT
ncbi:MAG: helicase-related protein [Dehalococcoidia bacterium]